MKTFFIFLLHAVFPAAVLFASASPGKTSLSGKVTDLENGEGLPGVSIYFPDLKTGSISKEDGSYLIENLPSTKVLIKISMTGYATITETIDLSVITKKDFIMERSITEMSEVVITGLSQSAEQKKVPTPISVVSQEQLLQGSSTNIIDAISKEPGVSQLSSGASISKPIIRGLGYNRVVVVNDGIRQEGQQWGDEHGIEIDEYSVSKVEILKGPASLAYGSDAMAGVVHMISFPTQPEGTISGNFLGKYSTNSGRGYSANLSGNLNGVVWDLRYSGNKARCYYNKYDGFVYGSAFEENALSGIFGVNKSWGYSHLHFSSYRLIPGIAEGKRDSATGKFTRPVAVNDSTVIDTIVSSEEMRYYRIEIPHQDIRHYKAVVNNSFVIKNSRLNVILGGQQNHRQEFANALAPDEYQLYFLMNTLHYDVRYIFPEKDSLQLSVGANGMKQNSENKGEEFLIPEYNLFDLGGFFTAKKAWKKLDVSGGLRYDMRSVNSYELLLDTLGKPTTEDDPFHTNKFEAFTRNLSNVSGSIGMAYSISERVYTKFNVSRGFRSPNLAELGSNGMHEGTFRYELGNKDLKAETSQQFDFAFGIISEHVTAEIDLFSNSIVNFIFLKKLNSVSGGDSIQDINEPAPVFKFTQGNASLSGGEISIDIHPHPLDWLHFENSFSYVQAVQKNATDSTKYLPFTPAPKFSSELRAEIEKAGRIFRNAYIMAGAEMYMKQDKVYSAYGTETETPAYTLIHAGLGADMVSKEKKIVSLFISISNLTDVAYQSHLSRLKYADRNNATGRIGVFNAGRNISIKILVPIGLKKAKE